MCGGGGNLTNTPTPAPRGLQGPYIPHQILIKYRNSCKLKIKRREKILLILELPRQQLWRLLGRDDLSPAHEHRRYTITSCFRIYRNRWTSAGLWLYHSHVGRKQRDKTAAFKRAICMQISEYKGYRDSEGKGKDFLRRYSEGWRCTSTHS